MDNNILTIQKFYTAFQQKDFATMNSCYADDIAFSDPVFGLLRGNETKLCGKCCVPMPRIFLCNLER
jgi:ketosteroid isomerase-like protein